MNAEVRSSNQTLIAGMLDPDRGISKAASNAVNEPLRLKAREDGFTRWIITPLPVTRADLDRAVDHNKPMIIKDMEPNSAGARVVGLGTGPSNWYMDTERYVVNFHRLQTVRYRADIGNLLTYDLDIRTVFNDLMLKDLLDEEDSKVITVIDSTCGGLDDGTGAYATAMGTVGYASVGAMGLKPLTYAFRGMGATVRKLNAAKALVNNQLIWDIVGIEADSVGRGITEEMFNNGFTRTNIMGKEIGITIKHELVSDTDMYLFAAEKYLGDFYVLQDVTVRSKAEDDMIEFYASAWEGMTFKNIAGLSKASFTGEYVGWRVSAANSSSGA